MTKLERLDAKIVDARKQLDKAINQRDAAIAALTKAADRQKLAQRTLARLDRQRVEARAEERRHRKGAAARATEGDAIPVL